MVNHRALVLKSTSEPLLLDTRPIPSASTGSVVVKVLGLSVLPYMQSVINGSLHYLIRPPMVLGSSCIGRVHDVGSDATSLTPGQLVYCDMQVRARDDPNLAILMGLHGNTAPKLMEGEWRDGSYAEYAKFPTENIFPLNEELLFEKFGYTVEDLVQLPGTPSLSSVDSHSLLVSIIRITCPLRWLLGDWPPTWGHRDRCASHRQIRWQRSDHRPRDGRQRHRMRTKRSHALSPVLFLLHHWTYFDCHHDWRCCNRYAIYSHCFR